MLPVDKGFQELKFARCMTERLREFDNEWLSSFVEIGLVASDLLFCVAW